MREIPVSWSSPLISLHPAALDCLHTDHAPDPQGTILSGTSKDGGVGWLARGQSLEVFTMATGERLTAWSFGASLRDPATTITAVVEMNCEGSVHLVVATTSPSTQAGLICVIDVHTSRIIKSVEVPFKVTALETIVGVGTVDQAITQILSDHLACFAGIVAAGTHMGHVYLLDLTLDDDTDKSDEVRPNSIQFLDPRLHDVASARYKAVNKKKHLCLELDDESHSRGYFYYRKPDSSIIKTFAADDVLVSSMLFCKQTGTLIVGFNFGCFQLWRLSVPVLEYSSRMEENLPPITHMAYQEPENDPRNYTYLWVCRGPLPDSSVEEYTSSIMLSQLGYNKKTHYEGVGHVYEELTSVGPRFEHDLTADPYNGEDEEGVGSRLVSCYTIQDPDYKVPDSPDDDDDSFEEMSGGADLGLCVFVWEAAALDPNSRSLYHLAIFDMNRWYHAQMPSSIRSVSGTHELCSYFTFCGMEALAETCSPDDIMAVHLGYRSISRFQSCIIPAPEQHFFPSSLAFDVSCISESGLCHGKYLGIQRQILSDLQRRGPAALLEPSDMYNLCLFAGLLPRNMDITSANLPLTQKREALLCVALENDMIQFITACINQWASGEHTGSGCTLRFLLDWTWAKVGSIKDCLDKLCVCLYDWSGSQLDPQTVTLLHHYQTMLHTLVTVFQTLNTHTAPSTEQGRCDLETKMGVVSLISQHLDVVLWFYTMKLLPEHAEDEDLEEGQYSYPARTLAQAFTRRRQEIHNLHSDLQLTDILLIDGLLEKCGPAVGTLWEKESGNKLYPPPSLHALLNIYLLEDLPLVAKHSIVLYLLFDLMHLAPEDTTDAFSEKLKDFAQAFSLPQQLTRLVQGLWLLDHKEYEETLLYLLDPMVRGELEPWQNTRIIKAFLYQAKHKMALKFLRIKKPPTLTQEDVKLKLTVLLANGLTSEAFEYQRVCRDKVNSEDLLSHLVLGCQQTKMMDQLLQLPLSEEEERHLVAELRTSQEHHSAELLVMHYLQRARYIEAIRLNAKLRHSVMGEGDLATRERAVARNSVVDCYHHILPRVQRKMAFETEQAPRRAMLTRREVMRPAPLSAVVNHNKRTRAISHATLIQTVLDKVKEVREELATSAATCSPQPVLPSTSSDRLSGVDAAQPGPFICTPVTPRVSRRVSVASELVYPSVSQSQQPPNLLSPHPTGLLSPHPTDLLSPHHSAGASRLQSPLSSTHIGDMSRRRTSRFYSSAALSLLQTPPVRRKTPGRTKGPPAAPSTPQSILKVRHRPQRNTSVNVQVPKPTAALDLRLPTPPRLTRKKVEMPSTPPQANSSAIYDANVTGTPKQLRFNVPVSPESPAGDGTPEVEEECVMPSGGSPSQRSIRDRSPTPERMSPKLSPRTDQINSRKRIELSEMVEDMPGVAPSGSDMEASCQQAGGAGDPAEDVLVIDDDITFNFDRDNTKITHEPMDMSHDTEPLTFPSHISATEDRVQAESATEDRVQAESAMEDRVQAKSAAQDRVQAESAMEERVQTESAMEDRVQAESESEEDEQSESDEDRVHVESDEEDRVHAESDEEDRVHAESDEEDRVHTELEEEDRLNTESAEDNSESAAWKLEMRESFEEDLDISEDENKDEIEIRSEAERTKESLHESDIVQSTLEVNCDSNQNAKDSENDEEQNMEYELNDLEEEVTAQAVLDMAQEVMKQSHDATLQEQLTNALTKELQKSGDEESKLKSSGDAPQEGTSQEVTSQEVTSSKDSDIVVPPGVRAASLVAVQEEERAKVMLSPRRSSRRKGVMPKTSNPEEAVSMFKTPPRPTRISVMPPTPPESGKGTPPQEVSPKAVSRSTSPEVESSLLPSVTLSRSSRKPTVKSSAECSIAEVDQMDAPSRRTRSKSRSVSPAEKKQTENKQDLVNNVDGQDKMNTSDLDTKGRLTRSKVHEMTPVKSQDKSPTAVAKKSPGRPKSPGRAVKSPARTPKSPGRTPTRRSHRGRKQETINGDMDEGPLSEGSFMMGLRSRKSVSRETSPDSYRESEQMSEASSIPADENMVPGEDFKFSEPMSIETKTEEMLIVPEPEVSHSFVFSPPLTRTRSQSHSVSTPPVTPGIIPPPPIPDTYDPVTPLVPSTKRSSLARDTPPRRRSLARETSLEQTIQTRRTSEVAPPSRRTSLGRNTPEPSTRQTRRSSLSRDTPGDVPVARRSSLGRDTPGDVPVTRRSSLGRDTPGDVPVTRRSSLGRDTPGDVPTRRSSLGRDTPGDIPLALPGETPQMAAVRIRLAEAAALKAEESISRPVEAKKAKKQKSAAVAVCTPTDSPISFLTPPTGDNEDPGERGTRGAKVKRTPSMTLRPRKGPVKKKPLKLY